VSALLNIALVGAGSMGRNHARTISESPATRLAVVVDPFPDAGQTVADSYGSQWVADLDSLSGVDAVVVAASTEYHYDIATQVAQLGLPMLIEKPVTPSIEQTEEIVALMGRKGLPLMCGFLERYNPAVLAASRLIEEPLYVRADRHSPYAPRIRTGVGWDLLVHDVDLIARLVGEPTDADRVTASLGYFHPNSLPGAEDVGEISVQYASGPIASASASRIGQRKTRSISVQMLERAVEIDLLRRSVTAYRRSFVEATEAGGFRQTLEMEVPEVDGPEPLAAQLARFVRVVSGVDDMDAERNSILPPHRILAAALSSSQPANAVLGA
jgi:predicted dehydrogenase